MDAAVVAVSTVVAIITSFYLFGLSRVQFLKKHWLEYRCNPLYMPMAGFVGDNVVTNFTKCTMKGFQDYAGFVMDPIMGEFAVVNDTLSEVGTTMSSMRDMMSGVRGGFLGIIGSVFGKIQNLVSQFQYIIIRMRTLLSRVVGVMLSFIYVFYAGMETGGSVMNGPIGQTVSFLCFDPDTLVVLKNNTSVPMQNIKIGDVLYGGDTVKSVYTISGKGVAMYLLNGVVVSGYHKVVLSNEIIPVSRHPLAVKIDKELETLTCLDTDTHRIHLRGQEFLDFSEKNITTSRYYSEDTRVILDNGAVMKIHLVPVGTVLKNNNKVIGRVKNEGGYSLLTEKNVFSILREDGYNELVPDALFFLKITSE
jgi:hypothetical protein